MLAALAFLRMEHEGLLLVRATVHLRGLRVGAIVLVDPTHPLVAEYLAGGYLAPCPDETEIGPSDAVRPAEPSAKDG